MPQPQNEPRRPGWTHLEVPSLSLTFTGRHPFTTDDPLFVFFVDDPQPETFRHFDLVERAALRALALGVVASLDIYESATRDDS